MATKSLSTVTRAVATAPARPWPKQTEITTVARQLDNLVMYRCRIERALDHDLRHQKLENIQMLIDEFAVTGMNVARLEARLNDLEPSEWRDEDWNLQQAAVSKILAILVGSFPTSNLPDAAVFTRVLLDDIMALDPDFLSLEGACRKLRQTQRFMPAICEIVEALKVERKAWTRRYEALELVEDARTDLISRLADERSRREAKTLPMREGDLVRHERFGEGRVCCLVTDGAVEVEFTAGGRRKIAMAFLTKVLS